MRVSRTCTEIREGNDDRRREVDPQPLEAFRSVPAYVLLGDPGAGKSTAFDMERAALGEEAVLISARDFRAFDPQNRPEWQDKTLFLDGLDEVRAGSSDACTPFDEIRARLEALGKPRFRLSCREADWLGANDRERLKTVSPDSAVKALRLDPLTYSDIVSILNDYPGIGDDAQAFIDLAYDKGVDGFLTNPQTLELLAKVIGAGGEWPASRKELFGKACASMVREHNEEHQAAKALCNLPDHDQLLNAAGRLCAVQLISGTIGWTLHGEGNDAYPELGRCQGYTLEVLRSALGAKLFKAASDDNRFIPIHRHIAEFLAARYLAGVIQKGVPARRIIALITGRDGIVITEMRGLSAWLAAHCQDVRAYLIEQDPVGVGLYGDIGTFFRDEKRALLYSLKSQTSRLDFPESREAAAFRGLATQDMESVLKDILTDSDRGEEHQKVVDLVVRVLQAGERFPDLSELLLEIVRDDTRWPRVRYAALDAFLYNAPDDGEQVRQLKALLEDIQNGSVADPIQELLGGSLTHLYPRHLSPSEAWGYFSEPGARAINGRYYRFWQIHLIDRDISSDDQVAELLDGLSGRLAEWRFSLESENRELYSLPITLLFRGLEAHGDRIDAKRLYDWLDVGLAGDGEFGDGGHDAWSGVRSWLEQRPDAQKKIVMEGLRRCSASDSEFPFDICASGIEERLYGASAPSDYGLWCLEQAVGTADSKPRVAEYLLEIAARALESQRGDEGLSREVLQEQAEKHEVLRPILKRLLKPPPPPPDTSKLRAKIREEQEQFMLDRFRSNEVALRENRVDPDLLYEIARKYFSGFANSGGLDFALGRFAIVERAGSVGGVEAVRKWLYGDQKLTDAALEGLRGVIDREDLPDVEEILDLEIQRRMHYLGLPLLAALEEIQRTMPEDDASQWSDDRIRRAVVFYYCYGNQLHMPSGHGYYCPEWYRTLLAERPEIVAEALVQYGRCVFEMGHDYADPMADKFRKLELDPDHAQVARYATLPLLNSFPIRRAPEDQSHLLALNHLFWAAIKHADRALLQELIERKRSLKSMTAAQRVRWLAAGAMVWPGEYTDLLQDFVQEDQENRVRYLKAFFGSRVYRGACRELGTFSFVGRELFPFDTSKVPLWELFIRLMGNVVGPDWWGDHASDLVRMLINDLVVCPEEEASDALVNLLADPALEKWRDTLKQAQDNQRTIRRDAGYRHPDIEQVCQTLDGGTPANPADLAALVIDCLNEIGGKIRRGPTSDWRQYWNVDSYNRPLRKEPEDAENSHDPSPCQEPEEAEHSHGPPPCQRPEDACRDNLLSDLEEKLKPLGIDAQPEGQYANDKRADIRVFHAGFNVPVEVKKNSHLKLWSSIRDQLIAKYTMDPDTDGYGIYLVFWFGKDETRTPHERGYPKNPEEMKQWLEDSLSPEQACKIPVCVIDVSKPKGKS